MTFTCHSQFVLLPKCFISCALVKYCSGCISFTCYRENCSQELSVCSDLIQLIAFSLKLTPAASHQLSGLWHLLHLNEVRTSFSLISLAEVFNTLFKIGIYKISDMQFFYLCLTIVVPSFNKKGY